MSDEGTGIPDEIVSKIFDPMFSTKPFGEATGLGLSVVHDIMLGDFEGTIDVKTRVGEARRSCFASRIATPTPKVPASVLAPSSLSVYGLKRSRDAS